MFRKRIKVDDFNDIDLVVSKLLDCKLKGNRAYCIYRGVKLYSDNITLDKAYLLFTGYTKDDYLRKKVEEEKKYNENIDSFINELYERGKKIIYPHAHKSWYTRVFKSVNSSYRGQDVICALEIMEALESGCSFEDVKPIVDNIGDVEYSKSIINAIVFNFSRFGPDYFLFITNYNVTDIIMNEINKKRELNNKYNSHKLVKTL